MPPNPEQQKEGKVEILYTDILFNGTISLFCTSLDLKMKKSNTCRTSSHLANGRITPNMEQQKEGKNEKYLYIRNHFDGADSLHSAPDSGGV